MRGPYCIGWGRAACKAPRYAEPPSYTTAKPLQQHNDPCSISRTNLWKSSHARYNQTVIPEPNALWSLGWRSVSTLQLSPACFAVNLPEALALTNRGAGCDKLDLRDSPKNPEVHEPAPLAPFRLPTARPQRLKPSRLVAVSAWLKPCPSQNLRFPKNRTASGKYGCVPNA